MRSKDNGVVYCCFELHFCGFDESTVIMSFFHDKRDWFFDARYGMFIHFGLYTFFAKQEQVLWRWGMKYQEYDQALDEFRLEYFDAREWLDLAEANGMRYLVITAKHHDGFCLWDTKLTDYNVMRTPFGKDIIKLLSEECHRRNFPLVIYYSVVDWHNPTYPNIGRSHEIHTDPKFHDGKKYLSFLTEQVRELCTNYGQIDGFWWDMNVMTDLGKVRKINNMIRALQPSCVINNRGFDEGDFSTPERDFSTNALTPFTTPTEACDAIGAGSWAYREEEDYISYFALQSKMASYLALGANFLLGVAPRIDGRLSPQSQEYISMLGKWLKRVGTALRESPIQVKGVNYVCTGDETHINLFLLNPLKYTTLELPMLRGAKSATLLNDNRELPITTQPLWYIKGVSDKPVTRIREIPINDFPNELLVIRLEGNFKNIIHKAPRMTKCRSWFAHSTEKE